MGFLLLISSRNLLRQKRRNLLLGAAMAIGMGVLVVANAFSHGISDVLFNRILTYVTGHASVAFSEKGNFNSPVFRDGPRMLELVKSAAPEAISVEEAVGVFARAIGNGRSDNVILVGTNFKSNPGEDELRRLRENFNMEEGGYRDLARKDLDNPVLLAETKAKYLNVKVGDVLRVRFQDIHGRSQAARLTIAGIFKPANVFMSAPVFLDLGDLKRMAGYGPGDIGQLHVTLPDPTKNAVPAADAIHGVLKPSLAAAFGGLSRNGRSMPVTVLGFKADSASLRGLRSLLFPDPSAPPLKAQEALVGRALAESLSLRSGDRCVFAYRAKRGGMAEAEFKVTRVLPESGDLPGNLLLVDDKDFYGFYYEAWPAAATREEGAFLPDSSHPLYPYLDPEWILMDRTATTAEMQKKYRDATRLKTRAVLVDVQTMYESASMIVKLEYALNLITLAAVLILFFIIQVGVVNTLRMTIRERTREIGTMRAIGMQRGDVRLQFLLETFFLSCAACAAGVGLAFLAMWLLGLLRFRAEGNPLAMLLVDGHIHFLPSLAGTAMYLLLILAIAAATAWFPAKRAANLQPSDALRHFG